MRINRVMMVVGLLVAGTMLGGCDNKLKEENALLMDENQSIRAQLADRNAALESANQELRDRDMQNAELQRELGDRDRQVAETPRSGFDGIPGVSGSVGAGQVTATVEGDVLFDAGKTTLKSAAKNSLNAVANVLNSTYGGQHVRVAGHTDSDPIKRSGFKSNYHLGFERAYAVREYLVSRGVAANRISLGSHGPDMAMATKAKSRRVEIVVLLD